MKLEFNIKQPSRCRTHSTSIDLPGYYGTDKVINDFDQLIEYHTLKYEDFKRNYIITWGQEKWDQYIESEK